MKRLWCLVLCAAILISLPVFAFADDGDELDVSTTAEKIAELGVPTVDTVKELKSKADNLWNAENWAEAAEAYETYAAKANWLANLITKGLEPYYSSSSDDRKSVPSAMLTKLAIYERMANNYKSERNRAIMRRGICYYKLGDYANALTYLSKALELIPASDTDIVWSRK